MNRIRLKFASLEIEFADIDHAIKRVEQWAEKTPTLFRLFFSVPRDGKTY
ncbi:MAG: hypothetical protein QXZ41_07470 [Ignisphaera sp.]